MTRKEQLAAIIQQNREIALSLPGCGAYERNGHLQGPVLDKCVAFFIEWNPDENEEFEICYERSFLFFRAMLEHPCEVPKFEKF